MEATIGVPPNFVTRLLKLDGLAVFAMTVTAYALIGGNWWLFTLLILAPDLAFLAMALGPKTGAKVYDVVHSYTFPIIVGAIGYFSGIGWLLPIALIWAAHIGIDRAIGYGLKYPSSIETTHLGLIGRARKDAKLADAS
jgi:hypothetical protein